MTLYIYQTALPKLQGRLREYVSLSPYTSWRIGGPARYLYEPADKADLAYFLSRLPEHVPLLWLGLGSNILIRDRGFPGIVILTRSLSNSLFFGDNQVRAEAGMACPRFARFCARHHLEGSEFLSGIPGTLGGTLAMNAGCHGKEIWDMVTAVETIDRYGKTHIRSRGEYFTGYRHVITYPNEWFTAGYFKLAIGEKQTVLNKIQKFLSHRVTTQPIHEPSCGSVFHNPKGDHAARLVEVCGLKGVRLGGAQISAKHANFITHNGHATAADIESLIKYIADTVLKLKAIQLSLEVRIVGEAS